MAATRPDFREALAPLHRRGFALLEKVFSPDEIADLRRAALAAVGAGSSPPTSRRGHARLHLPRDLLSEPSLRGLVTDDRILAIAEGAIGGPLAYFGMTKLMVQWKRDWIPYHRDNLDALLHRSTGPDDAPGYSLIRIGLYLQEHRRHGGSLWLVEGSHQRRARWSPGVALANEVGDVAVWSLRTAHGVRPWRHDRLGARRFPDLPGAVLHRLLRPLAPRAYLFWREPRIFIHMVFGRDDQHMDRFVRHVPSVPDLAWVQELWSNARYDDDVRRAAREKGLKLLTPGQPLL